MKKLFVVLSILFMTLIVTGCARDFTSVANKFDLSVSDYKMENKKANGVIEAYEAKSKDKNITARYLVTKSENYAKPFHASIGIEFTAIMAKHSINGEKCDSLVNKRSSYHSVECGDEYYVSSYYENTYIFIYGTGDEEKEIIDDILEKLNFE